MKRSGNKLRSGRELRRNAEAQFAATPIVEASELSSTEVLHELRVHQIELEMQNEALRQAQIALEESRDRYADLYEFAPIGYITLNADGLITATNLTGTILLGRERKRLLKQRFGAFVMPEDRDRWSRFFQSVKRQGGRASLELSMKRDEGIVFQAQLECAHEQVDAEQRGGARGAGTLEFRIALTDVTVRKQSEQALRIAATAFESHEAMMITDARTMILQVNRAYTEMTGYSSEELVGRTPRLLNSGRHDAAFFEAMWASINRYGSWDGEIWNRRKGGELFPAWTTITAVKDGEGKVTHFVSTQADIAERKIAEDEINRLAFFDSLTGLPNRRMLIDRLRQALAASGRTRCHGAVMFIDLDNFKNLNDTLGHDIGDIMLQQVAGRLLLCVREGDTVARLGGDEFMVMLNSLHESAIEAALQAEHAGKKILTALNRPYDLAGHQCRSTPSIGVSLFTNQEYSVAELLKRADLAMYQAKAAGRNTLRFFDEKIQLAVAAYDALDADFRQGLVRKEFVLHFQPQMDAQGQLSGFEALVRWQHSRRGMVAPADFIRLGEETGLIVPLGEWILETACAQLAAWEAEPAMAHITMAVNVSAVQFRRPDYVEQVLAVLDQTGANPQKLKLEITESVLLDDVEDIILKMTALQSCGIRFSLDDFGTGFSSLSYLNRLPIDQLKIDQSFVADALTDDNAATIVTAIIALSQSLGLAVIAEGVETEEQRVFLANRNCHAYQGFLFSRPLPIAECERFMKPKQAH